ncbi:hypothetical protein HOM50_00975 [bacterium]|jgi:dihydrofolate synthase/folylpolyglutamate synthase|nr:hypothetical protein [bacterium]MBT5014963.1 hypothetical protein [bacterium]
MNISKQKRPSKVVTPEKNRSYSEVVEYLDSKWHASLIDKSKETIQKLDKALGSPAEKMHALFVSGSNGKSLTINFTAQLLKEEGLKVGGFYSPHLLTYNERISLNNETIANKTFADLSNEVINAAAKLGLDPHAQDLLVMTALLYFKKNDVEVALCEMSLNGSWDPITICNPLVMAVTRLTSNEEELSSKDADLLIKEIMTAVKKDSWVVSADQSKLNLQIMQDMTGKKKAQWAMPIRKLATLSYPFEQLHGRCAALAERIAQLYVEHHATKNATFVANSLLVKPKGQRGRPTLEAKRQSELNPKKTIEHFWKETQATLPGRFELLNKEKPSILLDNSDNLDAFKNLLLGVRLLHYQHPLKGLTIIIGCEDNALHTQEFLKAIRYFFKKTAGSIIFCPLKKSPLAYDKAEDTWDVDAITNDVKNIKVKAKAAKNLADAYDIAKKSVDERQGLLVVTGSRSILNEYWDLKGIKKFS